MTIYACNDNALSPSVGQTKRGFTLTEIAIVLGIIGLILGAIWVAAAAVYNNLRISHANTEVLQIAQGIRALYATSNTTTGLDTDQVVCAKAVPSDLITTPCGNGATGVMSDPWPSGKTFALATSDNLGFEISLTAVPQSACINLLMAVAGVNRDPGLFMAIAAVDSGASPQPAATATPQNLPVATPALANQAVQNNFGGCNSGGAAGLTQVTFGFTLK